MTKHKQIIDYIRSLSVGSRISVRKIAQEMDVSEGTAYRAIKDAEAINLVSTSARVGTVRLEQPVERSIEQLTYKEILLICEGTILGGASGLNKVLKKFVIGAMTVDEMEKYITFGDILIVGNREDAQLKALEKGCAILISGGFGCSSDVKKLSEEYSLPVISSGYDTFTIARLINKALSDKLIKKDIILVKDIMIEKPYCLKVSDKVIDWKRLVTKTSHSRFPVISENNKVVGIVTSKDVTNYENDENISEIMTKNPIVVNPITPVAYASQLMIWEGIELIPVEDNKVLVGVLSRQDVIKVLQFSKNQPQVGETIEGLIMSGFSIETTQYGIKLKGNIPQSMKNYLGTVSCGALSILMLMTATEAIRKHKHLETLTDSVSIYYIKPAQLNTEIEIEAIIIESGRKNCKIEIKASSGQDIISKAMVSVKTHKKQIGGP